MVTPTPTIGRVVYFVLPSGAIRPAVITNVFPNSVNLSVQLDGPNDGVLDTVGAGNTDGNTRWAGSVVLDQDGKAPGTWHWMEYQLSKVPAVSESAVEKSTEVVSPAPSIVDPAAPAVAVDAPQG